MKYTDDKRLRPEVQEAIRLQVTDFLRMKKSLHGKVTAIFLFSVSCALVEGFIMNGEIKLRL